MSMTLFSPEPRTRLAQARSLTTTDRARLLETLAEGSPYKPWPRGMPSSVNPLLVVVGVSPGNSPSGASGPFLADYTPVFGVPAPGFSYADSSYYWEKVRLLSTSLLRVWDRTLSDDDCIALTGHLNFGIGMFGVASKSAVELEVVTWVSAVLQRLRPRLVVGLGLVGFLTDRKDDSVRRAWAEGGLAVDWLAPTLVTGRAFRFRHYTSSSRGERIDLTLWHNHPSKVPFGGRPRPGGQWETSVLAASEFLGPLVR